MKKIPERIVEILNAATHVVLVTHIHPDGDALGSLLGLADILEGQGKKVFRYLEEPVSHLYDFLPDCDLAETDMAALERFVASAGKGNIASISLDCGDCDRLGDAKRDLLGISPFVVIDHHHGHRAFGDLLWLESDRSSTGEMVYELAQVMGAQISIKAAFALYVAISTDTGSFRYENTSARTLRIAADLVASGVRPEEVADKVYDNYTIGRLRLMEMVLATLQIFAAGQVGLIQVSAEMFERTGATAGDVEGFVNYPRALRSVRVAVFLKEVTKGTISVSLRAKGDCDVAAVAASFGGGGHRNAAGFRFVDKTMEDVQKEVLAALEKALA
ncbi:MAG: bifunctional oligoribonuclease/PAP phosphatase NrnA [Proteobacteria bacterium]|nr:bifunctional oligoribonuclease/PAP phosphatase NrnA [Pseudomonadota bacterium]MBU1233250.1 bifunctional oligoribonuclease/PAP phosphatase NrnA [Pseudomonadota bacterium]MBU1417511.1 bifunctional oligoribonuclease/PAP phosphatase NrnA [Pseudomonadota bacterium]MBU1456200.1 bifunctional oligoribonuclease/PAP phosphatase NrnA [Pseudomonadota bacterium]